MFTLMDVRPALKAAVETQGPDFVYNPDNGTCFYVPQPNSSWGAKTRTGCLIGVTLNILGLKPQLEWEGLKFATLAHKFDTKLFSDAAVNYLAKAQYSQDAGQSWGKAYALAEEWYGDANDFEAVEV